MLQKFNMGDNVMTSNSQNRIPVAVLGGTGFVGRRIMQALSNHPLFCCGAVIGSSRTIGRSCEEVFMEKEKNLEKHYGAERFPAEEAFPECLADKKVLSIDECIAMKKPGSRGLVISAIAPRFGYLETELRDAGFLVVSISPFQRQENPLCVLEANASVIKQAFQNNESLPFVKSPNCVCCGASVVLAALAANYGKLDAVSVISMQSISGRGDAKYTLDKVAHNIYPLRGTEEETEEYIQEELLTVLGENVNKLSVSAFRVDVKRGHTIDVNVKFAENVNFETTKNEFFDTLEAWSPISQHADLPSVPKHPIVCNREFGFPRPLQDFSGGNSKGYAVTVGNVKFNNGPHDVSLTLVVDNIIKGAAGAGLQLLEYSLFELKKLEKENGN